MKFICNGCRTGNPCILDVGDDSSVTLDSLRCALTDDHWCDWRKYEDGEVAKLQKLTEEVFDRHDCPESAVFIRQNAGLSITAGSIGRKTMLPPQRRKGEKVSKKTCRDCFHCSIEGADEVYCCGMPWHYPFGGSDTVTLDKEACEHFLERDKPTVFHQISASPEVLAEKLVYVGLFDGMWLWRSTLLPNKGFENKAEAIAATVAKLKEVAE